MNGNPSAHKMFELVRSVQRAGLLTDIDGTISRIAPHPDSAIVEDRARMALDRLAQHLTLVGAVSGRTAEDARRIVGLDSLVYSGNHGMEIWRNGRLERSPIASRHAPEITHLLDTLEVTRQLPELYVENKGLTASIHYRGVADPETVEQQIVSELEEKATKKGLRITRGRMVIEVRPPVELSKGTSVTELIREYQLDAMIFLGDDVTDVDAFVALRDLRANDGGHYYGIGVDNNPTPEAVIEFSDALVRGVDGVIELLESGAA